MAVGVAPPLTWQGSLFASGAPRADTDFARAVRRDLGNGSWVEHVPGWLSGADQLFTSLVGRLRWETHEMPMYGQLVAQPRLSAWWALSDEKVRQPELAALAEVVGRRYGVTFESIGANLYRERARQRRVARRPARPGPVRPRRRHRHPLARLTAAVPAAAARGRPLGGLRRHQRRPAGDGWCVPARLAAHRAEDGARRAAPQHHLPLRHPVTRRLRWWSTGSRAAASRRSRSTGRAAPESC